MHPLARSLRPKTFSEVQGHPSVIRALKAVLYPLKHHTFLLSGSRGLGKTTLSRLIGQALMCPQPGEPCGTCPTCQEIHEGRYSDFIEIDAASKTKVEEIRELVQSSYALPLQGKYKIYLFDEAHMLSAHSFNALLKAFEEPPAHVVYILATTDPHKILPTVRSRCLNFHLQMPASQELHIYLEQLCNQQLVAYHPDLLSGIVVQAQGSYRDLLNVYQHALLIGGGSLTDPILYEVLAVIDSTYWEAFFEAYNQTDLPVLRSMLHTALQKVAPELYLRQLFTALYHQSILSEAQRVYFYVQISEFPRLGSLHPDRNQLLEILIFKACIEFDRLEKKNICESI